MAEHGNTEARNYGATKNTKTGNNIYSLISSCLSVPFFVAIVTFPCFRAPSRPCLRAYNTTTTIPFDEPLDSHAL